MRIHAYLRAFATTVLLAAVLALAGCAAPNQTSTDENAAENRAFMAQVNQKVSDLNGVLGDFQMAVGAQDVVAMRASSARAASIISDVKAAEAPEKLVPIKDGYVEGLDKLQSALDQYTQLYAELAAGSIEESSYTERLRQVQETYDAGVAALNSADEQAVAVANE